MVPESVPAATSSDISTESDVIRTGVPFEYRILIKCFVAYCFGCLFIAW